MRQRLVFSLDRLGKITQHRLAHAHGRAPPDAEALLNIQQRQPTAGGLHLKGELQQVVGFFVSHAHASL